MITPQYLAAKLNVHNIRTAQQIIAMAIQSAGTSWYEPQPASQHAPLSATLAPISPRASVAAYWRTHSNEAEDALKRGEPLYVINDWARFLYIHYSCGAFRLSIEPASDPHDLLTLTPMMTAELLKPDDSRPSCYFWVALAGGEAVQASFRVKAPHLLAQLSVL